WGVRFCLGSLSAGVLWGFAGYALMPDALAQQVLILFVLGGMAAAAAGTISCFMPAYFEYLVPALTPAIVRLIEFGGDAHWAMVAMTALFMGALTIVARNVQRAFVEAFRLRFENADLLRQVSSAHASLVHAHAEL